MYELCLEKRKYMYPTKNIARNVAALSSKRSGFAIRVYKCPYCKAYHITKKEQG